GEADVDAVEITNEIRDEQQRQQAHIDFAYGRAFDVGVHGDPPQGLAISKRSNRLLDHRITEIRYASHAAGVIRYAVQAMRRQTRAGPPPAGSGRPLG